MRLRPTYLFCGDRDYGDPYIVDVLLNGLAIINRVHHERPIIVHGDAPGLDSIARDKAGTLNMSVHGYPAEWDVYGKEAGPLRNQKMLNEEDVNIVFAFHDNLKASRGTKDMINRALTAGIPTYLIQSL